MNRAHPESHSTPASTSRVLAARHHRPAFGMVVRRVWLTLRTIGAVVHGNRLIIGLLLAALTVASGVLWLAWMLIRAVVAVLSALNADVDDSVGQVTGWVTEGPIGRAVLDPVPAYLDAHSASLPVSGSDLRTTWLATAVLLYCAALIGARSARIGWAVLGILGVTAAYASAAPGSGVASAATTGLVWLLLSVPAYIVPRITASPEAPADGGDPPHPTEPGDGLEQD